jgi:hypothetical protein
MMIPKSDREVYLCKQGLSPKARGEIPFSQAIGRFASIHMQDQMQNAAALHKSSLELTGAITALANAVACKLSLDEIALIASILVQLGDTLATIAARESLYRDSGSD